LVEAKTDEQIAKEALLELAKNQFLPALKKLKLAADEQELVRELEEGEIKASDDLKTKYLRELFIKYRDEINEAIKSKKQRDRLEKTLDDLKNFRAVLRTERELLEVFKPDREKRIRINTGEYILEFKVKPIEPGDDLSIVNMDERILERLTAAERVKLRKGMTGMLKNEKEEEEYLELMFKLDQLRMKSLAKETENVAKFLATFLSPPDDKKKALEFWKAQSTALQSVALIKTLEALGLSKDETDKLFRLNKVSGI